MTGPFLGLGYDGLGLGDDGTLWGGELLWCDYTRYRRLARFGTAPLPGGEAAVRKPARMVLGYLFGAENPLPDHLARGLTERLGDREARLIRRIVEADVNCPRASSAGRLFDAVAALLGLCDETSYEGEAAVLLEAAARRGATTSPLRRALRRQAGRLAAVAELSTQLLLDLVGWRGSTIHSSTLPVRAGRSTRLADLTRHVDATEYLCGPGGARYLDEQAFTEHVQTYRGMTYGMTELMALTKSRS